jgi:hypothetical protein
MGLYLPGTATDKGSFGSGSLDLGGGIFYNKININYKNVIN